MRRNRILQISLITAGLAVMNSCASKNSPDEIRRNVDLIWNKAELNKVDEVYAKDFVRHEVGREDIKGTDGIKQRVTEIRNSYPDLVITVDDIVVHGNKGAARYTIRATNKGPLKLPSGKMIPATGKQIAVTGISFWVVKDGKIIEEFIASDNLDGMRQLGLLPPMK